MALNTTSDCEDAEGRVPMYQKVAWTLHKKIINGDYGVGTRLPTEKELCGQFEVSRHTVREALRLLRQEGLISSNKKAGTIVEPFATPTSTFLHAQSVDDLLTYSYRWVFTTRSIEMSPLDESIRQWAVPNSESDWLKICGIAHFENSREPECWFTNFVHHDYTKIKDHLDPSAEPLLPLIEKVCKVLIVGLEQEVSAIALPKEIATVLRAENDTIAMNVRRIGYLISGQVAFITNETYPASRFKYRFSLDRQPR